MDPARLRSIPFFASLSGAELAKVAGWTDEVEVPAGERLTREGGLAVEFAVIEDGAAEVFKGDEKIADLGPGDFFGEIGLIETNRRTATVVAVTPMRLVVMLGRDFRELARELPEVAAEIEAAIRERLARTPTD